MKNSTKIKAGLLLTSLACAAGATAALVLLPLLAGCGASGPEAAGSGLEEVSSR